jgi:hypothetical protein
MKHTLLLGFFFLTLFVSKADAYSAKRYKGDGHLVDQGWWSPGYRFILDLGPIEIGQRKKYEYKLLGLPETRMTFGLEIQDPAADSFLYGLFFPKPLRPKIRMLVTNSQGKEVIREEGRLHNWTWSRSSTDCFVYRNGEEKDAGRGSSFLPRTKEQYILTVEILKPDTYLGKAAVKVIAVGGGWK